MRARPGRDFWPRFSARFNPGWLGPALVAGGGCLGTWARAGLDWAGAAWTVDALAFAWTTATVNLLGAVLLGWLTGRTGPAPQGVAARAKMAAGTGFCGAFTTYSSLSLVAKAALGPNPAAALGVAVAQVALLIVAGVAVAAAGVALGRRQALRANRGRGGLTGRLPVTELGGEER